MSLCSILIRQPWCSTATPAPRISLPACANLRNPGVELSRRVISARSKGTHMTDLLDETLAAHGGLARWKELTNVHTHLASTGAVWAVKGQTGLFSAVDVDVDPHEQRVTATPFVHDGWRGIFERDRVRVENAAGEVEEERAQPRSSFDGHQLTTQWDHLHAILFGGAAIWALVPLPVGAAQPGFTTEEIEP